MGKESGEKRGAPKRRTPREQTCVPAGLGPAARTTALTATIATAATATTTEAAAARLLRTSLVDGQRATTEGLLVQLRNRALRVFVRRHFHKAEAAGTTRFTVAHDGYGFDGTNLTKEGLKIIFVGLVGEIADVQLAAHLRLPHPWDVLMETGRPSGVLL